MQENNYCVYKHTSPSNKVYIGITSKKPEHRWNNGRGYPNNKHFTNAINKYGWDNFKHEVLFENLSKEEACKKEIELITFYKSNQSEFGYNKTIGGEGTNGHHLSPEAKRKISENSPHYWKGKHFSLEHCQKISEFQKGKKKPPRSQEYCQNISKSKKGEKNGFFGKRHDPETCRKISEINKERKLKKAAAYKEYKANGGILKWNDFQREYKNIK